MSQAAKLPRTEVRGCRLGKPGASAPGTYTHAARPIAWRSLVIPALSRNPGAGDVDSRLRGKDDRGSAASYFHSDWPCRLRPTPPKMEMVVAFGGSEDAGGDARAPSLGPRSPIGVGDRLRGDDGWWAGMTILVYQPAPGVIFRGMTLGGQSIYLVDDHQGEGTFEIVTKRFSAASGRPGSRRSPRALRRSAASRRPSRCG